MAEGDGSGWAVLGHPFPKSPKQVTKSQCCPLQPWALCTHCAALLAGGKVWLVDQKLVKDQVKAEQGQVSRSGDEFTAKQVMKHNRSPAAFGALAHVLYHPGAAGGCRAPHAAPVGCSGLFSLQC